MPRPTATYRPPEPRRRRREPAPPSLFDAPSPPADAALLEDLSALVALGLLEERATPEGTVFALTELGLNTP
jgi:hypothetical protein